jgi:hypothetical protein
MLSESIEVGLEQMLPSIQTEELPSDAEERIRQFANVVIDLFLADRSNTPEGRKGWVN